MEVHGEHHCVCPKCSHEWDEEVELEVDPPERINEGYL